MSARDTKIRNVGPKSAAWLRQVGVRTLDDLTRIGPVEAFLKVKRAGFRPSLNLLYSMAGALADCHWTEIPDSEKQALVAAAESAESANPIRTRWEKQKAASDDAGAAPHASERDGEQPGSLFDEDERESTARDPDADISRFD